MLLLACSIAIGGCSPKDNESLASKETAQVIKNKGSDTMVNLAQAWAERYIDVTSKASVEVSGGEVPAQVLLHSSTVP